MSKSKNVIPINQRHNFDTNELVLVKPGKYKLAYIHHETRRLHNSFKLVIWFSIVDFGENFGKVVARYYNVQRLCGKPSRNGNFKVGPKSDFAREFATLFGVVPARLDRFPMSKFKNDVIVGDISTVTKGADQRKIPECLRYSVVKELITIEDR